MKQFVALFILLAWVLAPAAVQAETETENGNENENIFTVDKTHASIGFSISHLLISKVKGHFNDYEASLALDDDNQLLRAEATIQVNSIDTGIEKRDAHLLEADFFEAETFPTITFVSKEVRDDVIVGDLKIRDETREVELPYEIKGPITDPWGNTKLGFSASHTINRMDYGIAWNSQTETGGLVVGEDVELTIDMEFTK